MNLSIQTQTRLCVVVLFICLAVIVVNGPSVLPIISGLSVVLHALAIAPEVDDAVS